MSAYVPRWRLRFCEEDDLLTYEPNLLSDVARDKWSQAIDLAMDDIERRLRATNASIDAFEMGRIGIRSKERLRGPCAAFALHYLYDQNQTFGDGVDGRLAHRARVHRERGEAWLSVEAQQLDYDLDNSGTLDDSEKQRPFPSVFIRG